MLLFLGMGFDPFDFLTHAADSGGTTPIFAEVLPCRFLQLFLLAKLCRIHVIYVIGI